MVHQVGHTLDPNLKKVPLKSAGRRPARFFLADFNVILEITLICNHINKNLHLQRTQKFYILQLFSWETSSIARSLYIKKSRLEHRHTMYDVQCTTTVLVTGQLLSLWAEARRWQTKKQTAIYNTALRMPKLEDGGQTQVWFGQFGRSWALIFASKQGCLGARRASQLNTHCSSWGQQFVFNLLMGTPIKLLY